MSNYLDRFFQDAFNADQKAQPPVANSFENATDEQVAAHLDVDQYEEFQLTQAVRPAMDLKVKPVQGYRHDVYVDDESGGKVPVVMAAVSKDKLFSTFIKMIQRLGPVVDVVLESSHADSDHGHVDLYREHIDMPVLVSILYEYEDILTNDGCTGIAVLNPSTPQEIQFEEHKLLIVYGSPLEPFEFILENNGVTEKSDMKFITEAEHIHSSSDQYVKRFENCVRIWDSTATNAANLTTTASKTKAKAKRAGATKVGTQTKTTLKAACCKEQSLLRLDHGGKLELAIVFFYAPMSSFAERKTTI